MLDKENNEKFLPTIKDLALESQEKIAKDTYFQNKSKTTRWGWHEL
jgi:hypothetical protein